MSSAIMFPKSSSRFHVSLGMDRLWCSCDQHESKWTHWDLHVSLLLIFQLATGTTETKFARLNFYIDTNKKFPKWIKMGKHNFSLFSPVIKTLLWLAGAQCLKMFSIVQTLFLLNLLTYNYSFKFGDVIRRYQPRHKYPLYLTVAVWTPAPQLTKRNLFQRSRNLNLSDRTRFQ